MRPEEHKEQASWSHNGPLRNLQPYVNNSSLYPQNVFLTLLMLIQVLPTLFSVKF